jgi:hypothetical protein
MNSKGKFPYDFAVSLDIFGKHSSVTPLKKNTDKEYMKEQLVWLKTCCKSMLDYILQYFKLDVYLHADVFECFRRKSMSDDGLEPIIFRFVFEEVLLLHLMVITEPHSMLSLSAHFKLFGMLK